MFYFNSWERGSNLSASSFKRDLEEKKMEQMRKNRRYTEQPLKNRIKMQDSK